jgi:hypothetical protein
MSVEAQVRREAACRASDQLPCHHTRLQIALRFGMGVKGFCDRTHLHQRPQCAFPLHSMYAPPFNSLHRRPFWPQWHDGASGLRSARSLLFLHLGAGCFWATPCQTERCSLQAAGSWWGHARYGTPGQSTNEGGALIPAAPWCAVVGCLPEGTLHRLGRFQIRCSAVRGTARCPIVRSPRAACQAAQPQSFPTAAHFTAAPPRCISFCACSYGHLCSRCLAWRSFSCVCCNAPRLSSPDVLPPSATGSRGGMRPPVGGVAGSLVHIPEWMLAMCAGTGGNCCVEHACYLHRMRWRYHSTVEGS